MTKWRVVIEQDLETGDWAAWCPELPGCTTAGETPEECLENIQEAIELYLQQASSQKKSHLIHFLRGKYANSLSSSEAFALDKQDEIDWEKRTR